jgi:hypothetical protein
MPAHRLAAYLAIQFERLIHLLQSEPQDACTDQNNLQNESGIPVDHLNV